MKKCTKCLLFKSLSSFCRDSQKKDGYYSSCFDCNAERYHHCRLKNKQKKVAYDLDYKTKNQGKRKAYYRKYYQANKERIFAYWKDRAHTNLPFKLAKRLRNRARKALNGRMKPSSVVGDLGCTILQLMKYFESRFYPRKDGTQMTWDNYGRNGWHIDHIRPLTVFDLENCEDFKKACHFTNLQPLWSEDNLTKGSKHV